MDASARDLERPDYPVLAAYFDGEATMTEQHAVEQWAAAGPANAVWLDDRRRAWEHLPAALIDTRGTTGPAPRPTMSVDDRLALEGLHKRVAQRGPWPRGVGRGAERSAPVFAPVFAIVAAAALAIATVSIWPLGARKGATQQLRDFATAAGSRSTITLRDGTRLVLAPATRIRVPSDFGVHTRTVDLDGEAYFAVVHDERRPFTVRTSWAVTRDVGTAFVVRAYEDDHRTQVAVEEGSVSLDAERGVDGATLLIAGALGVVDSTGQVTVRRNVSLLPFLGWTQGALAFNNTPLREVARDLARAFDLQITVADSTVGAMLVTGTYGDEPVDAILEDITAVVGAGYERSGRAVVIHRRGRGAAHTTPGTVHPLSTALLGTARE